MTSNHHSILLCRETGIETRVTVRFFLETLSHQMIFFLRFGFSTLFVQIRFIVRHFKIYSTKCTYIKIRKIINMGTRYTRLRRLDLKWREMEKITKRRKLKKLAIRKKVSSLWPKQRKIVLKTEYFSIFASVKMNKLINQSNLYWFYLKIYAL